MSKKTHSPLPWRGGYSVYISDSTSKDIACVRTEETTDIEECWSNAEFIVQACNSHYELLDLLLSLEEDIRDGTFDKIDNRDKYLKLIQIAIARAEGVSND